MPNIIRKDVGVPVAKLTKINIPLSWTYVPRRKNGSQLVLDETQVYKCHLEVSGDFYLSKTNGRSFRIQHIGLTGTLPIGMNDRFKSQLLSKVLRRTKEELQVHVPIIRLDLIECLKDTYFVLDQT